MKISILALTFVATFVSGQDPQGGNFGGDSHSGATPTVPIVGNECGSLGPQYYAACCATAVADPSCPTAPPIVGNNCGSLGPEYHEECCATAVSDPSCAMPTGDPYCGPWGCGMTTKVVYTTTCITVTDCPETVTECPYHTEPITVTSTIVDYTTICPISATVTPPYTEIISTMTGGGMVTKTVYTTKEYTITSCPPDVTNCPIGVVTSTIPAYTTVCPESMTEAGSVVPPPYTPIVPPTYTEVVPPPNTEVVPPPAVVTSTREISPFIPPVASTSGGEVATETSAGVIEFTGAAGVKKVGTWGLAAGFLLLL